MGNPMALNVSMVLSQNHMLGEKIVTPRIINQQVLDYDAFCDYLAQGSTVTPGDVSAVMKQIEKNLPTILALNAKVIVSPEGLTFRPSVKGSITQSQLRTKLEAKRQSLIDAGDTAAAAKIDVNRELTAGDLATSDLQACIVIDLPKKWEQRFQQTVTFKRVSKAVATAEGDEGDGTGAANGSNTGSTNGSNGSTSGSSGSNTGSNGGSTSGTTPTPGTTDGDGGFGV